jgi:hypothetical protein
MFPFPTRFAVTLTILACSYIADARMAVAGSCDPAGADAPAIALARADVAATCDCAGAARHGDYARCSADVLQTRVLHVQLNPACRNLVQRCAAHSTCGRTGSVTCCRTTASGKTTCHVKRDAAHCRAPNGGSVCVGSAKSCCDACTAAGCAQPTPTVTPSPVPTPTSCGGICPGGVQTVFLILMENHNWADVKNSASAPYLNGTLLPAGAHAEQYYNPPGIHPSEPNYLWLEAGTNFGIHDDDLPISNHQSTTAHLVTQLANAGIGWKSYQENISGTSCPLTGNVLYAPKHNPMIFFDDVTSNNDSQSPTCIAHVRPYSELATDLQNGTVARYNFLTPNQCNDMHNTCAPVSDKIKQGDNWLATAIPAIQSSLAYQNNGVILITWDEGEGASDGPIGMIVLSPLAKVGYSNSIHYTHSSTLRSLQEIFGVTPLLGDATNATNLADLFTTYP